MNITTSVKPVVQIAEVEQRTTEKSTTEGSIDHEHIHTCGRRRGDGDVKLACGCSLPVVASACSRTGRCPSHLRLVNTPTRPGRVNDVIVDVMRDTGCSTVVVRQNLVRSDQLTGRKEACVLIDGVVKYYPTAVVDFDTPFFKGRAKAMCMENPLHDVIIGNIEGARVPTEADFEDNVITRVTPIDGAVAEKTVEKIVNGGMTLSCEYRRENEAIHSGNVGRPSIEPTMISTASVTSAEPVNCIGERSQTCSAVQTRAAKKTEDRALKPLKVCQLEIDNVSVDS
jgi:hypothetical protein